MTTDRPTPLCLIEGQPSDWDDELDNVYESPRARKERHDRAKAVCSRCPARMWCQGRVNLWTDSGIHFGIHLEKWREEMTRDSGTDRWSA